MKKSKIIAPALGLLLLSTAASVTGTVAWFTATNTFETEISSFAVTKLDGDLACDLAAGYGTTLNTDGEGNKSIVVSTGVKLGDASFDHKNKKLYTDTKTEGTYQLLSSSIEGDEANWRASTTAYYAVTWKMTFKYTYGADTSAMNLYFDNGSVCTGTQVTAAATGNTKISTNGFRIAFLSSTRSVVWANKETTAKCSYISGAAGSEAVTAYVAGDKDLIASDTTVSLTKNALSGSTSEVNYLGQFPAGAEGAEVSLVVDCVAWFEGTDENIINGTRMDTVAASLKFFSAKNA